MTDPTKQWSRVTALFEEALDLDVDARERLLRQAAESDPVTASKCERSWRGMSAPEASSKSPPGPSTRPSSATLSTTRPTSPVVRSARTSSRKKSDGAAWASSMRPRTCVWGAPSLSKRFRPRTPRELNARDRLAREARAAAALTHPAIATIYALEEVDDDLFIASELVRGQTLRAELGNRTR